MAAEVQIVNECPWLEDEDGRGFTIQRMPRLAGIDLQDPQVYIDFFNSREEAERGSAPIATICLFESRLKAALEEAGVI
jgi:hypothetical protein